MVLEKTAGPPSQRLASTMYMEDADAIPLSIRCGDRQESRSGATVHSEYVTTTTTMMLCDILLVFVCVRNSAYAIVKNTGTKAFLVYRKCDGVTNSQCYLYYGCQIVTRFGITPKLLLILVCLSTAENSSL